MSCPGKFPPLYCSPSPGGGGWVGGGERDFVGNGGVVVGLVELSSNGNKLMVCWSMDGWVVVNS